jgi:hypothetical protein
MAHDIDVPMPERPRKKSTPVNMTDIKKDIPMAVANDTKIRPLNVDPTMVSSIASAIHDLLARLPQPRGDSLSASLFDLDEPSSHQTLPVPTTEMPVLSDFTNVRWQRVRQLPGYRMQPIRDLGNDVFMGFPCFRSFADAAKARNEDAHGEVLTISDFTHDKITVNKMAEMIVKNGNILGATEVDYGLLAPGYHPHIVIFLTDNWTFKLVRDRIKDGAPVDLNAIYAWPGGANYYRHLGNGPAAKESATFPVLSSAQLAFVPS